MYVYQCTINYLSLTHILKGVRNLKYILFELKNYCSTEFWWRSREGSKFYKKQVAKSDKYGKTAFMMKKIIMRTLRNLLETETIKLRTGDISDLPSDAYQNLRNLHSEQQKKEPKRTAIKYNLNLRICKRTLDQLTLQNICN